MKKVLFRAPVLTNSGYGVHARQIARWLLSRKDFDVYFQVLPWGETSFSLDGEFTETVSRKSVGNNFFADISFQLQLPNEWNEKCAKINIGITAGVETDICNPEWIDHINKMNKVIVPSCHTKKTFEDTSVKFQKDLRTEISVIPESYISESSNETENNVHEINLSTDFNFLLFGQITGNNPENDRKNTFYAIKWFCEEFKDDPSVGLIIKTNVGKQTIKDRNVTKKILEKVLSECRKGSNPSVYLLHGRMSNQQVESLYKHRQVKGLISATRGEGFGLPLIEAAAADLPVLATNWSGHLDFLNKGKFISFDYDLKEIHPSRVDNKIFMNKSKWAEVKEEDFKKKIRKFRENYSKPKEWAIDLGKNIRNEFSLESVFKHYDTLFSTETL